MYSWANVLLLLFPELEVPRIWVFCDPAFVSIFDYLHYVLGFAGLHW